jgi:hypothetical protein
VSDCFCSSAHKLPCIALVTLTQCRGFRPTPTVLHFVSVKCTMHSVNSVYIATVTVRAITVRISNKVLHFFCESSSSASGRWAAPSKRPAAIAGRWPTDPRGARQRAGGGINGRKGHGGRRPRHQELVAWLSMAESASSLHLFLAQDHTKLQEHSLVV